MGFLTAMLCIFFGLGALRLVAAFLFGGTRGAVRTGTRMAAWRAYNRARR
jgi:hypothetical protein